MMRRALCVAVLLVVAGCWATTTSSSGLGHPVGPSLEEFGFRQRCGDEDSSCTDRALDVIRQLLEDLGDRVEDPLAQPLTEGQPPGILVITASSEPSFDFRTADGSVGQTLEVALDVTPTVNGENASYVVMPLGAFEIDPDGAAALVDALFVRLD